MTRECGERPAETHTRRRPRFIEEPSGGIPDPRCHGVSPDRLPPELEEELREAVEVTPLERERCPRFPAVLPKGLPEPRVLVDRRSHEATTHRARELEKGRGPSRRTLPLRTGEENGEDRLVIPDRPEEDLIEGHALPVERPPDRVRDGEERSVLRDLRIRERPRESRETPAEAEVGRPV